MQRTSAHKISSQKSYFNLPLNIEQVLIPNIQQSSVKNSSLLYLQFWYVLTEIKHCNLRERISTVFPIKKIQCDHYCQSSSTFQLSIENQNQSNQKSQSEQKLTMTICQWKLKVATGNLLKARETRVTKSWLVLILHLIANCDTRFLDQSHNEVTLNQSNPVSLRYSVGNCSNKVSW